MSSPSLARAVGRVLSRPVLAAVLAVAASAARPGSTAVAADAPAADAASPYQKLLAGATTQRGVVDVHHAKDRWFVEVPKALLGRDLLWSSELAEMPTGFVP